MSIITTTPTEITGLVASGTDDDSGTWNPPKSLDAPIGATGVFLWCVNTNPSNQWFGVRQTGKTTPHLFMDYNGQVSRLVVMPLGAGGTLDFYTENPVSVRVFVMGYATAKWHFYDIDEATPLIASTGSSWATRAVPEGIPGCVALITGPIAWRPVGSSATPPLSASPFNLIPVSDEQISINAGTGVKVYGYCADGIEWVFGAEIPITADGAWRKSSVIGAGKLAALIGAGIGSAADHVSVRPAESAFNTVSSNSGVVTGMRQTLFASLSESGEFDYFVEAPSGDPTTLSVDAWFVAGGGADPDPTKAKKLKLSGAAAVKEVDGSGAAVNVTHTYDHGILYSGDPLAQSDETRPTVLATFADVAVVDGECELTESDCRTGSIDALPVGASTRYLVLKDADSATGKFLIYPNVTITEE